MTAIVFSELKSDAFMISATIGNIYSGNDGGKFDVGFSMMLSDGHVLAYELRQSGVVARLYDPDWKWLNGSAGNKIPGIADWNSGAVGGYNGETCKYDGLTITMTMVLKDSTLYLWANGQFLGVTTDSAQFVGTDAVSLGVFTRTGTGATFTDISFSTDGSVVADYLAENIPAED